MPLTGNANTNLQSAETSNLDAWLKLYKASQISCSLSWITTVPLITENNYHSYFHWKTTLRKWQWGFLLYPPSSSQWPLLLLFLPRARTRVISVVSPLENYHTNLILQVDLASLISHANQTLIARWRPISVMMVIVDITLAYLVWSANSARQSILLVLVWSAIRMIIRLQASRAVAALTVRRILSSATLARVNVTPSLISADPRR